MSARSPRGSFSGASSEEVAADFGESLKDLQANNRYEISNLTIIAKENTEHAQAISEVLQHHIKTTAPPRKLPALYVLDSIVKNVGTPYTVYLGRNLYQTFMEAYTLVDGTTRRNMEAMLKTWKEPVPGAMDPRPVFQPETVRPIENALIKARTAALQRGQPPARNTPTPPHMSGHFNPPPGHSQLPQPQYTYNGQQPTPQQYQHYQPPPPQQSHQFQYVAPPQHPVNDLEVIKNDLQSVISRTQAEFAGNVYNHAVQQRLKALLDLQTILSTQQLDQASLQAIRTQVSQLASVAPATPQQQPPQPAVSTPQWQPPHLASYQGTPQQNQPFIRPPSAQPQISTAVSSPAFQPAAGPSSALAPTQIASLQALFANGQKPSTPQLRSAAPALQNASHGQLNAMQSQVSSAAQSNGSDLLASLARSGLLPAQPQTAPPPAPPATTTAPATTASAINFDLLASLTKGLTPSSTPPVAVLPHMSTPNGSSGNIGKNTKLPMTAASLKQPLNPSLLRQLYDDRPNQCSTCARRFLATDAGRAKKQRHLDWHFRVSMRLADGSLARGSHRSWFPDEITWIQQRDFDVSTATADEAAAGGAAASSSTTAGGSMVGGRSSQGQQQQVRPEDQFVRAPPGMIVNKCSICQEDMKASHPPDKDDWVFVNAAKYGNRIVHATCLAEIQAGQQQQQQQSSLAAALGAQQQQQRERSATPDSLLGKRKAEGAMAGLGVRVRRE